MGNEMNICNVCGANYILKSDMWECPACGNFKPVEVTKEELVLLWNASAQLRRANFQDAEELYTDFIAKYPKNCEGYWGRLLARYGIKYEDDIGGKKVPTICAMSIESVLNDFDYFKAVTYANDKTKEYYKREAAKFEQIRVEWQEKASKEARQATNYSQQQFAQPAPVAARQATNYSHQQFAQQPPTYPMKTGDPQTKAAFVYLSKGLFSNAAMLFQTIIATNPRSAEALFGDIISRLKTSEDNKPTSDARGKLSYADVNFAASCVDLSSGLQYVDKILECLTLNLDKASPVNFLKSITVFDFVFQLVDKYSHAKYSDSLYKIAKACQKHNMFDKAQKYYNAIISGGGNVSEAYWGLLQSKLNVVDDNGMIKQSIEMSSCADFDNAIATAENDADVNRYLGVRSKQLELIEAKKAAEAARIAREKADEAVRIAAQEAEAEAKRIEEEEIRKVQAAYRYERRRKKIKRIAILVLLMIVALTITVLVLVLPKNFDKFLVYENASDGSGYVVAGKKKSSEKNIVVRSSYKGEDVVGIAAEAFKDDVALESIELPATVKLIARSAFSGCRALKSINIPDSVTSIGARTFEGCSGLTSIKIPESVTIFGDYVFSYCSGLKSITIPDSVTNLGDNVFSGCSSLKSIAIPNSVTSIHTYAFYGCSGLTSITIPDSVTSIGDYAFEDCSVLKSIAIPNSVTKMGDYVFSSWTSEQIIHIKGYSGAPRGWNSNWNRGAKARICWDCQH